MKKLYKAAALLLAVLLLLSVCGCAAPDGPEETAAPVQGEAAGEQTAQAETAATDTDAPKPELEYELEPEPEPEQSEPEPEPQTATLCVCGDIVQHQPINSDALARSGEYDYRYIFDHAREYIGAADYSMCCLETTFNGGPYSGYPCFASPDSVAEALADAGMDFMNTACNHSLDTWFAGLSRTLDVLDEYGIDHAGTYRTQEERDANNGIVVKDINGISFAILAYTYGTNGLPRPDGSEFCVNIYNVDYMTNLSVIDYDLLGADMAAARALNTDVILVYMHWGTEYNTGVSPQQQELTDYLFSEGADIIIGGHPHVPEPMELREIENPDGSTREGFVCYCLGNFISNQHDRYTNLSAILNLELTKNPATGAVSITACSWTPMYMLHPDASNSGHYALLDIHRAMEEYEEGDTSLIGETVYSRLQTALDDLHSIMGDEVLREPDD